VFYQTLKGRTDTIVGLSLVCFESFAFDQVPSSDWVFFYSAQGVHYFFEGLLKAAPKYPISTTKWATIGAPTANALAAYITQVDFIGTGDPLTTATAFEVLAKDQLVLFPTALHTRNSVGQLLQHTVKHLVLPVYSNEIVAQLPDLHPFDTLVFTSPLNVASALKRFTPLPHQNIVAIGRTTALALKNHLPHQHIHIAAQTNEQALAKVCIAIMKG
jgi:uroporphyrinogen-III synthase